MATGPIPIISDALKKRLRLALATQGGDLANEFFLAFDRAFEIANLTIENAVFPQKTVQLNKGGTTANLTGAGFDLFGDSNLIVGFIHVNSADTSLFQLRAPTANTLTFDMIGEATLLMSANLSVTGVSVINQDVSTTGSPTFADLTIASFAANWTNAGRTIADLGIVTTVDIDGGTVDGTIIGGSVASAGTFTNLTGSTDLTLASGVTVTAILDEDAMGSNSATALVTQQSLVAFVASQIGANNELSEILANGNTTGANDLIVTAGQKITTDTIDETTAAAGIIVDGLKIKDTGVAGQLDTALAGTVSVTIGTAAVTGAGTNFRSDVSEGDAIEISGEIFTILTIADDTNLTLNSNHAAGASGVTANIDSNIFSFRNGDAASPFIIDKSGSIVSAIPADNDFTPPVIKSGNVWIQLNAYSDNDLTITTDAGAFGDAGAFIASSQVSLFIDNFQRAVNLGTSNEINILNNIAGGDITLGLNSGVQRGGEVVMVDNSGGNITNNDADAKALFLGTRGSTINSGVTNSVIIGGVGITATADDTVYIPDLVVQTGKSIFVGTNQVLSAQAAAEADPGTITNYAAHASGAVAVTSNAATDLDTTAAALDTLEDEVTTLRATVVSLLGKLRVHGIIAA